VVTLPTTAQNDGEGNKITDAEELATSLLNTLIWDNCITLPLARLDQVVKKKRARNASLEGGDILKTKTLFRGIMMDALVQAANGNDSILATRIAFQMVSDPFQFLRLDGDDREDRIQARIVGGKDARIPDLICELRCHFVDHPLLLESVSDLGEFVAKNTWDRASKSLQPPPPLPEPSATPPSPSLLPPKQRKQRQSIATKGASLSQDSLTNPIPIVTPPTAKFLPIALILREACNRARGFGAADPGLYQLLLGLGPNREYRWPPEQMDPVRATNAYARLMETYLPTF
jgi:hypothetical protein